MSLDNYYSHEAALLICLDEGDHHPDPHGECHMQADAASACSIAPT